jgi:hypothetical protein
MSRRRAVPFVVVDLAWAQRPRLGVLGRLAALAYASAFAFFAGAVIDAVVARPPDWAVLQNRLARRPRPL